MSSPPLAVQRLRPASAAWLLAEHRRTLRPGSGEGPMGWWDISTWGRAATYATTDGQVDAVLSATVMASRRGFDVWVGLRHDWRNGYTADLVQRVTANEEQTLAINYGARFGPLVIETVHRIDSKASYGQLSFVSSAATRGNHQASNRVDLQFGLQFPDMLFQLAGRRQVDWLVPEGTSWRGAAAADLRLGEPQYRNDPSRYVETAQLTLDLEWSRPVRGPSDWLRFYAGVGAGVRTERLSGRGDLVGLAAERVARGVLVGDVGIEIFAAPFGGHIRHSLRLGLTGWLPASRATVTIGSEATEIQRPGGSIVTGWTLNF